MVLIQPKYIFYRLIFCIGISILCLVATAVALPCRRPEDNFLSIFAQTTLLFSFGACTLVKILTAEDVTDEQLDSLIGFHSPQGPFFILCFFALSFCFVLLIIYVKTFYAEFEDIMSNARASKTDEMLTTSTASTGLTIGALIAGLTAGGIGGVFFGITGGIVGGLIFGLLGGIVGMNMASFCTCCSRFAPIRAIVHIVRPARSHKSKVYAASNPYASSPYASEQDHAP